MPLSRTQRIVFGLLLLLAVDVIWVASAEFTEYIFHELKYDKPYFSTYFKTSLFVVYLTGFVVFRPWRNQCSSLALGDLADRRRRRRNENGYGDSRLCCTIPFPVELLLKVESHLSADTKGSTTRSRRRMKRTMATTATVQELRRRIDHSGAPRGYRLTFPKKAAKVPALKVREK